MKHATVQIKREFRPVLTLLILLFFSSGLFSQATVRNPVFEHCTGTWCQFCPAGDQVIHNDVLGNTPNAIILAYHGPSGSSDPWDTFFGIGIISQLGFNAYPTAIIDRVTGIQSRGVWANLVANRAAVPATVKIDVTRSYDVSTRTFDASIDFTALTNLNGNFKFNAVLLEDGMVWQQTGPGGGPNYVHYDVVRDMMNGSLGTEVINGAWNQGDVVTKTFNRVIPVMPGPGPDITPDSCTVVFWVYEEASILRNSEIHQGVEMSLIAPDYLASFASTGTDYLGASSAVAQNTVVLHNEGLNQDTYTLGLTFDGPTGWSQEFTTVNGTFPIGQTDQLTVNPGDSTVITVSVNANSQVGFGRTSVNFTSQIQPANNGSIDLRFTTYGVPALIVDDDQGKNYESYLSAALTNGNRDYGIATSDIAIAAGSDLSNFGVVLWLAGTTVPTLSEDEMNLMKDYLDNGGGLYVCGLDLAYYLADPASGFSTPESQSFMTDYLHADYVSRAVFLTIMDGISGDPISDGFVQMNVTGGTGASTITFSGSKFANRIDPVGTDASPVFSYFTRTTEYSGVKSLHGTNGGKVFTTTFGFESVAEQTDRDLLAERIVDWLTPVVGIGDETDPRAAVETFALHGNYPNPFNPSTTVSYTLPAGVQNSGVSLVIYNQLGQQVRTLTDGVQPAGAYKVEWDARDDSGNPVASGVYVYRLQYGDYQASRKMVLLR